MRMLSIMHLGSVSVGGVAIIVLAAAGAITKNVCRMISENRKTRSIDHMTDFLKDCPAEKCERVAAALEKVADSYFPQPASARPDKPLRSRGSQLPAGRSRSAPSRQSHR